MIGLAGVCLLSQYSIGSPVPFPGPGFIGPGQTERKVWFPRCHNLGQGAFKKLLSITKPVMPVTESFNAIGPGKRGLSFSRFGKTKVIKPEVCRDPRLFVPPEKWFGSGHIRPLGESLTPPLVILWNGMKLRQVQRKNTSSVFHTTGFPIARCRRFFQDKYLRSRNAPWPIIAGSALSFERHLNSMVKYPTKIRGWQILL